LLHWLLSASASVSNGYDTAQHVIKDIQRTTNLEDVKSVVQN